MNQLRCAPFSGRSVWSLEGFDDGNGPALYAGGNFTHAGGVAARHIARWDGSSWSPLGSGTTGTVKDLVPFHEGGVPALIAGGGFSSAIDSGDSYLAKWGCSGPVIGVQGCFDNPARLSALSPAAKVGQPFALIFEPAAVQGGLMLLAGGASGTSTAGCGLLVPGIGEMLLALSPGPLLLAQEPIHGGNVPTGSSCPPGPRSSGPSSCSRQPPSPPRPRSSSRTAWS